MSPEPGAPAASAGSPDAVPGPAGVDLLDFGFEPDSLVALRNAVAAHASRLGLAGEQVELVVLAAYELASNAVRHGGGRGRLRLAADDGVIGCTVIDDGPGFANPGQAGLHRPEPTANGGRGLWLVRCIADTVEITSGARGTTAVARFAIR